MAKISETGHAINVANFESLISFVTSYGIVYNPSKTSILLPALSAKQTSAQSSMEQVNLTLAVFNQAVGIREAAFKPLNKLMTRVMNMVRASDISPEIINDIHAIVRKIQGVRATPKPTEEEQATTGTSGAAKKVSSSSQMSYDNRIENMDKLVKLLSTTEGYAPNEDDVKVETLQALLSELRTANSTVISTTAPLSNARLQRNQVMYEPELGLVPLALSVKTYVKAVFGATSPQYNQVSGLPFRSYKN